jgi:iron complex outermembrane receptor protein
MAAASVAAAALPCAAAAQDIPFVEQAQSSAARAFEIPSQPLSSALTQFGQQSGWQVSVNGALVQGKTSPGVSGNMTPEQAINRLFQGTGLTPTITGNTITISAGGAAAAPGTLQLDPVNVQGNVAPPQAQIGNLPPPFAGGEVARGGRVGALGNRDYMDTPFSVTTYTHEYIKDNQARTINEAVADDPTIRTLYAQGAYSDALNIRGFNLSAPDMAFNGLYGVGPQNSINLPGIERIEVFRGPSALLDRRHDQPGPQARDRYADHPGDRALLLGQPVRRPDRFRPSRRP